jgi:AP-1-like factor
MLPVDQTPLVAASVPDSSKNPSFQSIPPTYAASDHTLADNSVPISNEYSEVKDRIDKSQTKEGSRTSDSSEEKTLGLTPAQSRRKAQNRAAYVTPRFSVECSYAHC